LATIVYSRLMINDTDAKESVKWSGTS